MTPSDSPGPPGAAVDGSAPRSKDRVGIKLPLEVTGGDLEGQDFTDKAWTKTVSRRGAAIVLGRSLAPEQTLIIKSLDSQKEAEVRVIGLMGTEAGLNVYGVAFLDPAANIWGINFPAIEVDETRVKLLLECPGCQTRQVVSLSELELGVFRAHQHIVRNCPKCRDATFWKQSRYEIPSEPESALVPQPPSLAKTGAASAQVPVERRKNLRVKVELKGCILFCGQEIPIQVVDMSRGGIRFRCGRSYAEGLRVRVAIPYSAGTANIFVPAKICWCHSLPSGMSDCGLQYVKD